MARSNMRSQPQQTLTYLASAQLSSPPPYPATCAPRERRQSALAARGEAFLAPREPILDQYWTGFLQLGVKACGEHFERTFQIHLTRFDTACGTGATL